MDTAGSPGFLCECDVNADARGSIASTPRSSDDLQDDSYYDTLEQIAQVSYGESEYRNAFPAEHIEETAFEKDLLDSAQGEDPNPTPHDLEQLIHAEEDLLAGLPVPGVPMDEQMRRSKWLELPKRARVAIR